MPILNFNSFQEKQRVFASVQRIDSEQDLLQIVNCSMQIRILLSVVCGMQNSSYIHLHNVNGHGMIQSDIKSERLIIVVSSVD